MVDGDCAAAGSPICGDVERSNVDGDSFTVGECRACSTGAPGDAECVAKDSQSAVCEAGDCVECRESADCAAPDAPLCETSTNTCVGCVENGDCASEVCDASSGQCASIDGAQGGLSKVSAARKTLRLGGGTYAEVVDVDGGRQATLIGPATINPPIDNVPCLSIRGASEITLIGITLTGATTGTNADGVQCSGASSLRLLRSSVTQNDDTGIEANGCTLAVNQSTISENDEGGIDISATGFEIRNSPIIGNGRGGAGGSAIGGVLVAVTSATDEFKFKHGLGQPGSEWRSFSWRQLSGC